MKIALFVLAVIVAVILLLVALAFRGGKIGRPGEQDALAASQCFPVAGFESLIAMLQADLSKVDVPLDAPRQTPANAFKIKERLRGALDQHQEYQVLDRVCDLIIYADQERDVRAQSYKASQGKVSDTILSNRDETQRQAARDAIRSQTEAAWDTYRQKTSVEVRRLLQSLEGKKI
jgi:hypothetical protein